MPRPLIQNAKNLRPCRGSCLQLGWGGGVFTECSSIVKVPGDVPPARVYLFGLLVLPRIYFLAISVDFRLGMGMGMLFGNFGQRNVKPR